MWYNITGVLDKDDITIDNKTSKQPVIKITEFTKIESPEDPYIYPGYY